jgi:hypothetical protein
VHTAHRIELKGESVRKLYTHRDAQASNTSSGLCDISFVWKEEPVD